MKVCPECKKIDQVIIESYPTIRYERVTVNELWEDGTVDYDTEDDHCEYDTDKEASFFCPNCGYCYKSSTIEEVWDEMIEKDK
jgi:hypothetical protein